MDEFAVNFGKMMGMLVAEYRTAYAWLAPLPHILTIVLIVLVFRYEQKYRKLFSLYFILNYIWLLIFVGGWFSLELYHRLGPAALAMYGATPVFLMLILYQWIQEFRHPRLDLDFSSFDKRRLLVAVPIMLWGFWYPPYDWGVGLVFDASELLFGAYGLMACPTIMLVLALLFLKYPAGNRPLYFMLTTYAVCVGAAMVGLKYVPDIPFFFIGLASLVLIIWQKFRSRAGSV